MDSDRGKAVETFPEFNYSTSDLPCNKHPNSSPIGVCPYCLKEKLVKLVCSECGEQRLSSCSCSDASSSHRNSCSSTIGSVGRVSFLIENEKKSKKLKKTEESSVFFLRRSSSSCVEVKKSNGFWKIKRLFRKKSRNEKNGDEEGEIWVSDVMGVSRSRSLCSFRGGGNGNNEFLDSGSEYGFSSAKISDVTSGVFLDSEPRKSGFDMENGFDFRWSKRGFSQNDRGYSSVQNRGVFPAKESDFRAMDESNFIDLKLDLSSESKRESSAPRVSGASSDHGLFSNGGSCRVTVNENGLKRGSKSHKVWKWIFKYHKKDEK